RWLAAHEFFKFLSKPRIFKRSVHRFAQGLNNLRRCPGRQDIGPARIHEFPEQTDQLPLSIAFRQGVRVGNVAEAWLELTFWNGEGGVNVVLPFGEGVGVSADHCIGAVGSGVYLSPS